MNIISILVAIGVFIFLVYSLGPAGGILLLSALFGFVFLTYRTSKNIAADLQLVKERLGMTEQDDFHMSNEEIERELEETLAPSEPEQFPQLDTERLLLRKLTLQDASDLFEYFSKDAVMKYYDLDTFTTVEQAEELIRSWEQRYEKREGVRWGIVWKSSGRLIGTCGFHNLSGVHSKAEIGYDLAPGYWGQGIMTEALQEMIQYGFEALALNRIEALIDPEHSRSRNVLLRLNFTEEGLLRAYFYEKHRYVDAGVYSLLKSEAKHLRLHTGKDSSNGPFATKPGVSPPD